MLVNVLGGTVSSGWQSRDSQSATVGYVSDWHRCGDVRRSPCLRRYQPATCDACETRAVSLRRCLQRLTPYRPRASECSCCRSADTLVSSMASSCRRPLDPGPPRHHPRHEDGLMTFNSEPRRLEAPGVHSDVSWGRPQRLGSLMKGRLQCWRYSCGVERVSSWDRRGCGVAGVQLGWHPEPAVRGLIPVHNGKSFGVD